MRIHHWSPIVRGVAWTSMRVAVLLLVVGVSDLSAGKIVLRDEQIPPAPKTMKRLKNSRGTAPTAFVQKVLTNAHGGAKLEGLANSEFAKKHGIKATKDIQGAIVKDHVVATVDNTKGHADVLPDLESLPILAAVTDAKHHPKPSKDDEDKAKKAASDVLREGVFPSDATRAQLGDMLTLETSQFIAGEAGAPAKFNADRSGPILMTFPVKRMVGDFPVLGGKGSRGHIDVGKAGKVHGFSKKWQNATDNDTVTESRSQGDIANLIRQQLAELATKADIEVQDVQIGYYDSDEKFIQPVYQFRAKVTYTPPAGQVSKADEDYIAGYVPIGDVLEPIPTVNDKYSGPTVPQGAPTNLPLSQWMPTEPPTPTQLAAAPPIELPEGDPTVGRYVVRNDYVGWVNSANNFWNGLGWSGWGGYFTNSQYFWAYPFETSYAKNSYVNSVNVALLEVHGDWWLWTTYQNWGDLGYVDDIPYPGLGASAGGVLAYFIIHSCQVVASAADTPAWADKWWHVFGGLHSVLGYRTIMYIDDGAMWPFGVHMGWGYSLVNSWLSDVASSPLYWGAPGQVQHGSWKPYGRPSTISVCGHEGDSVYYTAGVGRAGCLQNYWYW